MSDSRRLLNDVSKVIFSPEVLSKLDIDHINDEHLHSEETSIFPKDPLFSTDTILNGYESEESITFGRGSYPGKNSNGEYAMRDIYGFSAMLDTKKFLDGTPALLLGAVSEEAPNLPLDEKELHYKLLFPDFEVSKKEGSISVIAVQNNKETGDENDRIRLVGKQGDVDMAIEFSMIGRLEVTAILPPNASA